MTLSEKKNLVETIDNNKKKLRVEYQRGYADGGKNKNEKWLITRQEFISEFVKFERLMTDKLKIFLETKEFDKKYCLKTLIDVLNSDIKELKKL